MQVYDSLTDVMGNTPLIRLKSVVEGRREDEQRPRQDRVPEPGGSVKDRIALRMVETAERRGQAAAGRRHRGADLGQHRRRAGHRRPGARLPVRVHLPGQGGRRQDRGAARLRRRGRGVPHQRAARPPRLLLQHRPPPRADDAQRLAPGPVRQPGQPGRALPLDRSGDLGADRRQDHPLRRGHRHRRHDLGHRPLPQGEVRQPGQGHRRRPRGLGLLGRDRPALPGRGRRRGHLADHLRPGNRRRGDRDQRRRLVRDDPAPRPRGGAARRRLVRPRRRRRARVAATADPDDVIVVILPDGGRGYLSKIFNDAWMADYGFLREQRRGPDGRRPARRQADATSRRWCTSTRTRPSPRPSRCCASTTSRNCRSCRRNRR